MRRLLVCLATVFGVGGLLRADSALGQCQGTSGTATINGTVWNATCVLAITTTCPDSLGNDVECQEILGLNDVDPSYTSVALFFGETPVQGRTYALGGTLPNNPNGAVVLGGAAYAITDQPPYVGEVTLNVYNPATGAIDCSFYFLAMGIFTFPDLNVTNGHFTGTILPVQPTTWSGVKTLYR